MQASEDSAETGRVIPDAISSKAWNSRFLLEGIMTDQVRRFELFVLRPLQILFLGAAIAFLLNSIWWGVAGCAFGLLYVGIIGSKLHPLQSAQDLAKGPLENPVAAIESEMFPPILNQMLVGRACSRVGRLIGLTTGIGLWAALGWHWYAALLAALVTAFLSGTLLRLGLGR